MRNQSFLPFKSVAVAAFGLCAILGACPLEAQSITVNTLHRFSASEGIDPYYGLTQGPDGTFYGACVGKESDGGAGGSVFRMDPGSTNITVLHTFNPTDVESAYNTGGANPLDGPLLGTDGLLYGCTEEGGTGAYGVIYSMTTNGGSYTLLTQFTATQTEVEYQYCGLVQGSDGFLYGAGGSDGINNWDSQTYKIDTNGNNYADLHYFTTTTGGSDYNPLLAGRNGNLYGVTGGDPYDDSANVGTVFMLTPGGAYTVLHNLAGNDGQQPDGGLIEDNTGTLYGTASAGGINAGGTAFHIGTNGLNYTVIHSFGSGKDGVNPAGRLLLASDGYLYGTTLGGGTNGYGTVFRMSTNGGNYQALYSFTGNVGSTGDHGYPNGCLIQASSGMIYGMTGDTDYNFDPPIGNGSIFVLNGVSSSGIGVQSINRVFASPTNLTSVQWTVAFAAAVTGVNATNFQLTAIGLTGSPAITSVSGSGTNWTVTASTGGGTGTLQLNLTNVAGLSPSVTNTLPFNGQAYAIDLVAPTITIGEPTPASMSNGPTSSVSYSVTYSDSNFNSSTLTAANVNLTNSGVTANVSVAQNSATNFTVTLSDLGGVGAQAIQITAGTATDLAGNTAAAAGPSDSFAVSNAVVPAGPSIVIGSAVPFTTVTGPITYTITYSDPNFSSATLAASDISLNSLGSARGVVTSVVGGAGSATGMNYTVTIANISGSGSLSISIAAGTAVNSLGGRSAAAGPSYPVVVDLWQFDSLYSFTNGADGNIPQGGLTVANGSFYGVSLEGGDGSSGTIYTLGTNGVLTVLYPFSGADDGGTPYAGLTLAGDGLLYGTTSQGGTNGGGTIFQISTNGTFQVINDFSSSGVDGWIPNAPMIQGADGYLYGTTSQGGENFAGNIFRVSTNGALTNFYSFSGSDGDAPMAPLFQAGDGNFYGAASMGGDYNEGTLFQITSGGVLTTLHSFSAAPNLTNQDGTQPIGGLVQGRDGSLYGVTSAGGSDNGGTVFRVTTNGNFSVIHALNLNTEGGDSTASLILGSDGNLYGTTQFGSVAGNGSVFQITTNGVLAVLYSFVGGSFGDGSTVTAPVLQGPDGNLYGAATQSGYGVPNGAGAIFELINPNPAPVIAGQPTNLTVPFGDEGSFTVSATSASPLTFQWTLNGTNIDGATNATLTLTNLTFEEAGGYSVEVGNSNAMIQSAIAILSVTPAEASLTLSGLNQTYDGTAKMVTATTGPEGLTVNLTYDDSTNAPTNAGSYVVVGTVNDSNYFGSVTNTLVVSNATLVASANSQSRYVNQPNPTFTGSLIGSVSSDGLSLSFVTTATSSSPAGDYDIVPAINDPNNRLSNYNVTLENGTLTVSLGQPSITLGTNSIFYTLDQDPVLLASGALFNAPSSPSFAGGHLTVQITTNAEEQDLLFVQNSGTGPGEIGASGGAITFGGVAIASYTGGTTNDATLEFTFNANANTSAIQALLNSLTFAVECYDTTNLTRGLVLTLDDGNSLTSAPVALAIVINHRPVAVFYRVATGTNAPLTISFARLLANCIDADNDPITVVQAPTNSLQGGVVVTNETGLIYTPAANYAGLDRLTYVISDGRTGTNVGLVYVIVLTGNSLAIEDPLVNPTLARQAATLGIEGIAQRTYRVQASDDLFSWGEIGAVTMPDNGFTNYLDTDAINHTNRFYRTVYP